MPQLLAVSLAVRTKPQKKEYKNFNSKEKKAKMKEWSILRFSMCGPTVGRVVWGLMNRRTDGFTYGRSAAPVEDRQVQHFGASSAFHFPSTSPRHKTKTHEAQRRRRSGAFGHV